MVYDYYRAFIEGNEYCPSFEEIEADQTMPLTTKTVAVHRETLKEDGLIDYTPGASRSVVIL